MIRYAIDNTELIHLCILLINAFWIPSNPCVLVLIDLIVNNCYVGSMNVSVLLPHCKLSLSNTKWLETAKYSVGLKVVLCHLTLIIRKHYSCWAKDTKTIFFPCSVWNVLKLHNSRDFHSILILNFGMAWSKAINFSESLFNMESTIRSSIYQYWQQTAS